MTAIQGITLAYLVVSYTAMMLGCLPSWEDATCDKEQIKRAARFTLLTIIAPISGPLVLLYLAFPLTDWRKSRAEKKEREKEKEKEKEKAIAKKKQNLILCDACREKMSRGVYR